MESAGEQYQQFCISTVPGSLRLDGLRVVVDCSHGAGYKVAPRALTALGAEIVPIGCSPNGRNINSGCGSTSPDLLILMVKGTTADIGIAFDGDGDRVVMVDHLGRLVDGDQLLYVLASDRAARKALADLGLSVEQLQGLSPDEQFRLLADRLSNVADATTRAALAATDSRH